MHSMPKPDPATLRRTATTAAVFDAQGRILLQQRSDNGKWGLPGGAIEVGETAEQGTVREVREETGYEVAVVKLIGVYSDPQHTTITYPEGDTVAYVSVLFECKVIGGAAAVSDESSAVDWFPPDALPEPFHAGHLPRIQDAVARQERAFYR